MVIFLKEGYDDCRHKNRNGLNVFLRGKVIKNRNEFDIS